MGEAAPQILALLETVRCLECSEVYSKPSAGGTVLRNPGCPSCGYVGWLSVSVAGSRLRGLRRSAADPPQHRTARSG